MEILPCNFPVINLSIYDNINAIIKKFRLEKKIIYTTLKTKLLKKIRIKEAMIKSKKSVLKKNLRTTKNYLKIINNVNQESLNFKLDSEEKLSALLFNVNEFMVKRLEANKLDECLTFFIQNMKRYRVLTCIMEAYSDNANSIYKEEIIKKLRVYSYKTISSIIDDALEKGYIKYINRNISDNGERKIKRFRPTSTLVSNYLNWTIINVANFNKAMKDIK